MSWGLDLMAPPLAGLNSDLDLWSMDAIPQDLTGMGALSFPFSPQPSAPGFLDASNSPQSQGVIGSPLRLDEALITTVVSSAIMDPSVTATFQQEQEVPISTEGILAPPAELPCSENGTHDHQSNVGPMEASMLSTEAFEDQTLLDIGDHQESGMDVDLPIQDMSMISPPPSPSRSKRRSSPGAKKPVGGLPRTRRSSRAAHSQRIAAQLAASMRDDNGDDGNDDDLERAANRIKRRRGSEDSSSSDSCPDSAPSSPRTPPSTFEGPSAPSAEHTLAPDVLYHVDSITTRNQDVILSDTSIDGEGTKTLPAAVICQGSLSDSKGPYLAAVVAVEDLVNLKHMEDDGGDLSTLPHGRYPSRRPSTRPFGRF